jgi:hypothetical protein
MNASKLILRAAVIGALAATPAYVALAQDKAAAKPAPAAKPAQSAQKTFASPEEASKALVEAVKAKDINALLAVVGPSARSWLFTGDDVADANDWKKFIAAYDEKNAVKKIDDSKAELEVGNDGWPFPAPIVKKGAAWSFDAEAGRMEILNRRVGRNELDAIQTLLAIVDAQREYAQKDADGNGYADYARKFRSSQGKKDGLYWADDSGRPRAPSGRSWRPRRRRATGRVRNPRKGSRCPTTATTTRSSRPRARMPRAARTTTWCATSCSVALPSSHGRRPIATRAS